MGINTEYIPVTLGDTLRQALGDQRLTKKWLRENLPANHLLAFRNQSPFHRGPYVNSTDAIKHDLAFEVHNDQSQSVAIVTFTVTEPTVVTPFGGKPIKTGERITHVHVK